MLCSQLNVTDSLLETVEVESDQFAIERAEPSTYGWRAGVLSQLKSYSSRGGA
jgi:hypothetical protein